MYTIEISYGGAYSKRLPYAIEKAIAEKICKILNSLLSPAYVHKAVEINVYHEQKPLPKRRKEKA